MRRIQLEDVGLAAVLLLGPLLNAAAAGVPLVGGVTDALGALVSLLAAVGAIAAMATRLPGESRFDMRDGEPVRLWMIGPFVGAVAFVAGDSLDRLGLPGGDALIGVAFIVVLVSALLADRLPIVSRDVRRLMVAPFVFLSALFFQGLVRDVVDGLDGLGGLAAWFTSTEMLAWLATVLAVLALASGIFYLMLIFVPRELANPGGSPRSWAVRFGVFYVSLLAAIALGSAVPVLVA